MSKGREWPRELRSPIVQEELAKRGAPPGVLFERAESDSEATKRLIKNYLAEITQRAKLMLAFFQIPWPQNDAQWLSFVMKICDYWAVPGFEVASSVPRGPGQSKKWTDRKNCELFADVNALVLHKGLTEYSACQHIARNPRAYKNRYPIKSRTARKAKGDARTLHRQYVRVKKKIQDDHIFRLSYFGLPFGSLLGNIDYGPDLIEEAIKRYAVAQES
jgi:hypothetical protein